jgi:DNA-binding SARP family transcriptional activator
VLALLLTRANQVVSSELLIDELWGENPPATAANVLQSYVSHLRKAVGSDVILTRPPGYVVQVAPDGLDLDRFERLVDDARQAKPEEAGRLLREALSLWRGPALADFAYEPFAQAEIARLEELRLAAVERRIEADLACGRHAELVGELEALVAKHPLREHLRGQLILSLYRSGRQAEALEVYQQARRALVDELGIEPSASLQELEGSILRQDPALDLPRGVEAGRASAPAELTYPERSILVVPFERSNLDALLALAEPLSRRPPREIIMALLVEADSELAGANAYLEERRSSLVARQVPARAATFTTGERGEDLVMLGSEQDVDLLLVDAPRELVEKGVLGSDVTLVLSGMPCDVGMLAVRDGPGALPGVDRPVLVPFGGAEHEWAAVELGAWVAGIHGAPLRLLGTQADPGRGKRDASRLLARAALMVHRVAGVPTEPLLVPPGDEAVIEAAESAGLLLVGLSPRWRQEGLGAVRLSVLRNARPPTLIVRRGLRPGGLAPRESLTRFTWTMASGG